MTVGEGKSVNNEAGGHFFPSPSFYSHSGGAAAEPFLYPKLAWARHDVE